MTKRFFNVVFMMSVCLLYSLITQSCSNEQNDVIDFEIGQQVQYEDLERVNKRLFKRTIDGHIDYRLMYLPELGLDSGWPWREKFEKIVLNEDNGFSSAIVCDIYTDKTSIEYWFGRTRKRDGYTYTYLGCVDYTPYDAKRHNFELEEVEETVYE